MAASSISPGIRAEGRRGVSAKRERAFAREAFGSVIVLVDTSVWIRFLPERAPALVTGRDEVEGHDFVYGGCLMGDNMTDTLSVRLTAVS